MFLYTLAGVLRVYFVAVVILRLHNVPWSPWLCNQRQRYLQVHFTGLHCNAV